MNFFYDTIFFLLSHQKTCLNSSNMLYLTWLVSELMSMTSGIYDSFHGTENWQADIIKIFVQWSKVERRRITTNWNHNYIDEHNLIQFITIVPFLSKYFFNIRIFCVNNCAIFFLTKLLLKNVYIRCYYHILTKKQNNYCIFCRNYFTIKVCHVRWNLEDLLPRRSSKKKNR